MQSLIPHPTGDCATMRAEYAELYQAHCDLIAANKTVVIVDDGTGRSEFNAGNINKLEMKLVHLANQLRNQCGDFANQPTPSRAAIPITNHGG